VWARRYFKDTEQAIERGEDRLNLYNKGLQSGYNDDAGDPAVMHACLECGQGPDPDKKRQNDLESAES